MSKYGCARDEVLDAMAGDGWATESSGDVESPTGWFAWMVNTPAEIAEILDAFPDATDAVDAGLLDADELVGAWLIAHDSQGFVDVSRFSDEREVREVFAMLDADYCAWSDENGEDA